MAELITTEQEKQALSFLDWDDASLGRAVKALAANIFSKHADGDRCMAVSACSTMLACEAAANNSARTDFSLKGVTEGGKELGDFTITVEARPRASTGPVDMHRMICVSRIRLTSSATLHILQDVASREYIPCCDNQVGERTPDLGEARRRAWRMHQLSSQAEIFAKMKGDNWEDGDDGQ